MACIVAFNLKGQCMHGKNHIQITRTGHRYPAPRFVAWRMDMLRQMGRPMVVPFGCLLSAKIVFTHADKRRRDVPGMLDALCHVLEKAGVVKDDSLIVNWDVQTNLPPSKELAGVQIRLETI